MTTGDPSTLTLRDAVAALEPKPWLRDAILAGLDDALPMISVAAFYRRYFTRLVLAFEDPEDAELAQSLFSRMLESEAVVNAHVDEQRDHLRHSIQNFLFGYLILNATSYFHPIAEAFARRVGYEGDGMACLNHAWFLAAHFHDLGYPIEFHSYVLDFVRNVISDFPHVSKVGVGPRIAYREDAPLMSLFSWRAGLYGGREEDESLLPARTVLDHVQRPDHGYAAAFLLWDRPLHIGTESPPERLFTAPVLRTAALACASHNFQYLVDHGKWFRISLACDPVSWLLHLVDEVQDWSRERIDIEMLWEAGVPKHRFARAILREAPRVVLDKTGRLDVSYAVAVQPLVDDPADRNQFLQAREFLERHLIERSRKLAGVLKIDWSPDVSVEACYSLGIGDWSSDSYEECAVRFTLGKRETEWKCHFGPLPRRILPGLERVEAIEVLDRQLGASVAADPSGQPQPRGCTLGEARIRLDQDGKVTIERLQPGTVYLLIGAGGVGKSTLLRHMAMGPPAPYSAFYLDVIPPGARELDLEERKDRPLRLFLVDHFDNVLSRREDEYWKEEIAKLQVPQDAAVILVCRTAVADRWPYAEARPNIRVLEVYRKGHVGAQTAEFVRTKLQTLRTSVREELARLAIQKKGERWFSAEDVSQALRERAGDMLRPVGESLRFDHDSVQDALAALGIFRLIARHEQNFDLGQALVTCPAGVYVFLLWSLCGESRGISSFLDVGREAYLRLRRETLDRLLQAGRALHWLEVIRGSEFGIGDGDKAQLPVEELNEALAQQSETVQPEHLGLAQALVARSLFYRYFRTPPKTGEAAKSMVDLALRFHDLGAKTAVYFASEPATPARWWTTRRCNLMMTRAYIWSRPWPEQQCRLHFWAKDWERHWEEEKTWLEGAKVDAAVKDYWLSFWMYHRAHGELENLMHHPLSRRADREHVINRLREAVRLTRIAFFHCRRAIAQKKDKGIDGFETLAQGLGQLAYFYYSLIRESWPVLGRLGEDPLGIVQMTVMFEREGRSLWERARVVLQAEETLSFFYPRCARPAAYAAAVRALRDNPTRTLYEVREVAEKVFHDWLKAYRLEATRDPSFETEIELETTLKTIQDLEILLRYEAGRWRGE